LKMGLVWVWNLLAFYFQAFSKVEQAASYTLGSTFGALGFSLVLWVKNEKHACDQNQWFGKLVMLWKRPF
jgi:glucose uptake protein GlcU